MEEIKKMISTGIKLKASDACELLDYIKELEHHKDTTLGLWAFDFDPKEILNKFNNSQSDAHSIECGIWEQLLTDWDKWLNNENYEESPFFKI